MTEYNNCAHRILIIDDDELLRKMLRRFFEREEYEVIDASSGNLGLRSQRERPADIILTDIFMPDGDGIETILHIKREFPNQKIIAMSGHSRLDPLSYLSIASKMGADRVFTKPLDTTELLSSVEALLGCESV